jgi:capsid portal protein
LVKFEHQGETDKIFTLCNKLGKSHSRLVSSLYLKTLNIDKRFLAKEPDWTNSVYVAKMILIYAAAEVQKRILDDAPSFFGKHLTYFKDKYPAFFKHEATETTADNERQMLETAHQKMIDRI